MTAMNGGGAFLAIFVAITFTLGLTLLLAEIAIGRAAGCGAVSALRTRSRLPRRWISAENHDPM